MVHPAKEYEILKYWIWNTEIKCRVWAEIFISSWSRPAPPRPLRSLRVCSGAAWSLQTRLHCWRHWPGMGSLSLSQLARAGHLCLPPPETLPVYDICALKHSAIRKSNDNKLLFRNFSETLAKAKDISLKNAFIRIDKYDQLVCIAIVRDKNNSNNNCGSFLSEARILLLGFLVGGLVRHAERLGEFWLRFLEVRWGEDNVK